MARPPKPIEQHLQEGTYRKDRHEGALVVTQSTGIAHLGAPVHLTEFQREVWTELARLLENIVRESDMPMVEGAAVVYGSYRDAQKILNEEGLTVTDDRGNLRSHPMIQVRDRSLKMFMDFSARLGLSPADRARLGLNLAAVKSAADRMAEQYGDTGDEEAGEVIEIRDAGMEPDALKDAEMGYDDYDEPGGH